MNGIILLLDDSGVVVIVMYLEEAVDEEYSSVPEWRKLLDLEVSNFVTRGFSSYPSVLVFRVSQKSTPRR